MATRLYEFRCPSCSEKFDDYVDESVREVECEPCGTLAIRIISAPSFDPKMGLDPAFPTMADRWARIATARHTGKIKDSNDPLG